MTDKPTITDSRRVLLAEDDPHAQMLFIMAAEDARATIRLEFKASGEELIVELRRMAADETLPTMVIVAMGMPGMGGHEVLDILAREPAISPVEVGVLATALRERDAVESLIRGAAWHEVKPSQFDELVAFVRRIDQRCLELNRRCSVAGDARAGQLR